VTQLTAIESVHGLSDVFDPDNAIHLELETPDQANPPQPKNPRRRVPRDNMPRLRQHLRHALTLAGFVTEYFFDCNSVKS
jgi:hypothetical protein